MENRLKYQYTKDPVTPERIVSLRHYRSQKQNQILTVDTTPLSQKMTQVRLKLRGVLAMTRLHKDLLFYGTSSNLLASGSVYKKNLSEIIANRRRSVRSLTVVYDSRKSCLISPESTFIQAWNLLMFLLLIYVFVGTPWIIAFEEVPIGSNLFIFELVIDSLFLCDIFITLNTGYYADDVYVTSRWRIFLNYLSGLLLIDLLSIFPFFLFESSNDHSSLVRMVRISKIVRIFRASKLLKIIKHVLNSQKFQKCIKFIKNYNGISRLVGGLFLIVIMAHFTACIWYFSAKLDDFQPNTWVVRHDFIDESKLTLYLVSYYWAFTILTTVGFGDITAQTNTEMLICIIWMVFGIGVYSFLVGTLTSVLSTIDSKNIILTERVNQIEQFGQEMGFEHDFVKRMKKNAMNNAHNGRMDDVKRLKSLEYLTIEFQRKACMAMFDRSASMIKFFSMKDTSFLTSIVPRLVYKKVLQMTLVYKKGDFADAIYFIAQGRVNYLIDTEMLVFKSVIKESYFGDYEMLQDMPRLFTVMTETPCQLLAMRHNVYVAMKKRFLSVASEIEKRSEAKITKDLEAKSECKHVLKAMNKQTELDGLRKREIRTKSNAVRRASTLKPKDQGPSMAAMSTEFDILEVQGRVRDLQKIVESLINNSSA